MAMVRVLHVSDTHDLHWKIEEEFPMDAADILVHTGDFSNNGSDEEIADFVAWLQHVSHRYSRIFVVPGNHDWYTSVGRVRDGLLDAHDVVSPGFMQRKMCACGTMPANCSVLDHEEVQVMGLRIWGSPWCPWHPCCRSDGVDPERQILFEAWQTRGGIAQHRFDEVPLGIDLLLTHGPADKIMDCVGRGSWGSSKPLRQAIVQSKPRMHFFGHLHEQRGVWKKDPTGFKGGIEYKPRPGGEPFPTVGPPPLDYPCELISCNPMKNHPGIDGRTPCIAGPARLVEVSSSHSQRLTQESRDGYSSVNHTLVDDASEYAQSLEIVRIMNSAHQKLLQAVGPDVQVLSSGGEKVQDNPAGSAMIAGISWKILACPHESGCVYIINAETGMFLDACNQRGDVQAWNNGGRDINSVISENTSLFAGNLRWRIVPCPHEPGTFYICNARQQAFLDTHGRGVWVWNNGGRGIADVIKENTSQHAGNLRWLLHPVPRESACAA